MSYKALFCYLVSFVGLFASVVFLIKGVASSPDDASLLSTASAVPPAARYLASVALFAFSFFAFVGARVVSYCDDSLALKEQANEIARSIKSSSLAKKPCKKCGSLIPEDAITCPKCGQ